MYTTPPKTLSIFGSEKFKFCKFQHLKDTKIIRERGNGCSRSVNSRHQENSQSDQSKQINSLVQNIGNFIQRLEEIEKRKIQQDLYINELFKNQNEILFEMRAKLLNDFEEEDQPD